MVRKITNKERLRVREQRARSQHLVESIREMSECIHCGYNEHPEILQFHHRDRHDPTNRKIGRCKGNELLKELKKCDIVCPNCHRWEHYKETGFKWAKK